MTETRLYTIWVCPDCGAWAGSDYLGRAAPPLCKRKAGERDKRVFPSCRAVMEAVEVTPTAEAEQTASRLREALCEASEALDEAGYQVAASDAHQAAVATQNQEEPSP